MILAFFSRFSKGIALVLLTILYTETVMGAYMQVVHAARPAFHGADYNNSAAASLAALYSGPLTGKLPAAPLAQTATPPPMVLQAAKGGPSQPEMQQFSPVSSADMVDLFTGDFSYNIPLLDVGGYPVNISYRSGVTMDQEASWVGLGWNINPGTITRNMRGLPDDFNGNNDTIRKTTVTKDNKTIGVTAGNDLELVGLPITVGASLGVVHNTYKGWGLELGANASINSGSKASGPFSGGLSMTNSSQEGLTISPYLAAKLFEKENAERGGYGSLSLGSSYNARSGLSGLQLSAGINLSKVVNQNKRWERGGASFGMSFAYPSFMPSINIPYTGRQYSFTGKVGLEQYLSHPSFYISGYVSTQSIKEGDRTLVLPAYGYLNYQNSQKDARSLLDFNREKDIPYREKPAIPHIAIPAYTYDVFSISGEGTGGSFRAYRGDIGYVHDPYMRTNDESDRLSVDIGVGTVFHGGVDLNVNRSNTQTGAWTDENALASTVNFRSSTGSFEAAYFRNPGEKTVNSKAFYNTIGGDDVVVPSLYQPSNSSSTIVGASALKRYNGKVLQGEIPLNSGNVVKPERDKRSQVITYLTALEADKVGLNKYIETRKVNAFGISGICADTIDEYDYGVGNGFKAEYFNNRELKGDPGYVTTESYIDYNYGEGGRYPQVIGDFSARWSGRLKAPVTGVYHFATLTDDGVRLYLNDTLIVDDWNVHGADNRIGSRKVNLIAGNLYNLRMDYFDNGGSALASLQWSVAGGAWEVLPGRYMYSTPLKDSFEVNGIITKEKRINKYRQSNHISEIDVLNADGRKYVYGTPVYNLYQKEVTFSVDKANGNTATGLSGYTDKENSVDNESGRDRYYTEEVTPAYAHSFLLTGIVSPDYVDLTGNGISDDDPGDAIKFNYTKTAGYANAYQWRAPYVKDKITYNEGLRTDSRDDRGSYICGKKELWYLNSIESKNMIATFFLDNATRLDALEIDEKGNKIYTAKNRRLRKISLYNKADFLLKDTNAVPIKTVYFEYSYELCSGYNAPAAQGGGKLTLKKIWFSYNGNEKGKRNPYEFTYHANNPAYNTNAYDRWGNYKSPADNPIASGVLTNADYPYVLQDSTKAANNAGAWTLSQIKLPSGGLIKADYESDDYAYVQNRRAMQMCKLAGLANSPDASTINNNLYTPFFGEDRLYAFIKVPVPVTSVAEVKEKYLDGISKLYFRLYVKMPGDKWGSGYEYVPCYADIDGGSYGYSGDMIWVKIKGINSDGTVGGGVSPLAKASLQYLRLNLASKAYPGSETGDNVTLVDGIKMILAMYDNIANTILSFDNAARAKRWAKDFDSSRSFVRLTCPTYKRLGGGLRVKRITVYDNWNAMTQQKEATYGQEYIYTTTKEINGVQTIISSGVAAYEPGIGGEENPFRLPVEYIEKVAALAPVTLGYTEEPLGEALFPGASVGYSKVRVRSIHAQGRRSANGYQETSFYTAYDFPTLVDRSMIDDETKKRFKPGLANFLKINARHFVTVAQGFKIELNDMHGKMKSQASYAENDPENYISYTENFYKVSDQNATQKQLVNTVMAMNADGTVDTTALIGKDAELYMDMREQKTVVNGLNVSLNTDIIPFPFPPIFIIPTLLSLLQREETRYRSAACTKVIQRFGILDSVVTIDKGSKVAAKNLLYDSETGDVLLTRTQNEFNDPIYNFTYPAHWAYDGMGMAYKNAHVILSGIEMREGRIIKGLPYGTNTNTFFASGDELLVASQLIMGRTDVFCNSLLTATYPDFIRLWAVATKVVMPISNVSSTEVYFVTKDGQPYSGSNISLKVIRSGRRNMASAAGSVTSLNNPLVFNATTQQYSLQLNDNSQVLNAAVAHYSQLWKVGESKRQGRSVTYTCPSGYTYSFEDHGCVTDIAAQASGALSLCRGDSLTVYSRCGAYIYSSWDTAFNNYVRTPLNGVSAVWNGEAPCSPTPDTVKVTATSALRTASLATASDTSSGVSARMALAAAVVPAKEGALNRSGVWNCSGAKSIQFTVPVFAPRADEYYLGFGVDNRVRLMIDSQVIVSQHLVTTDYFHVWHVLPVTLSKGMHQLSVEGFDDGVDGTLGVELYDNSLEELKTIASYDSLKVLFSTKQLKDSFIHTSYTCPSGYNLVDNNGTLACRLVVPPSDSLVSYFCYSALTDTLVNPYTYGIAGNYRMDSAYVYYGKRSQTMGGTLNTGDIRKDGAFTQFAPFWKFNNGKLEMQYDTTRWVWTTTPTLFNLRGFELENKDPLNRFNAGLYGYNNTLPVAVAQNSRYCETAFDGFEDYNYGSACATGCPTGHHLDFSMLSSHITAEEKHSGKYSLKVSAGTFVGVGANISDAAVTPPVLDIQTQAFSLPCVISPVLKSIRTDGSSLIPSFSPLAGKKIVFSVWVKEQRDCKCEGYTGNEVVIGVNTTTDSASYVLHPQGAIIEGWQRYEGVRELPANTKNIGFNFKATGTSDVYFDDVRIHPYNANMKSFVYHPVNLRLMAELDENNYATFYEYDDDGTLTRVKKETQRGIKTIKETRSALRVKEQ